MWGNIGQVTITTILAKVELAKQKTRSVAIEEKDSYTARVNGLEIPSFLLLG